MAMRETIYGWAMEGARRVAPALARGESKRARSVRGHLAGAGRIVEWSRRERDPGRRLAWFHAPSVGEGLQARAVLRALARGRNDLQLVYTYFSPSAEGFGRRLEEAGDAGLAAYLPWDVSREVAPVLDALRPDLLVFTKTEVWPVLSGEAARRGAAQALVGGVLPPGSRRLGPVSRFFLAPAFGRLEVVATVDDADADRFRGLGADPGVIEVTGDPAVDAALERLDSADPDAPYMRVLGASSRPTVVAGSTWRGDESALLAALVQLRKTVPGLRLVVAPHEPTPGHVDRLEAELRRKGWETARLGELEAAGGGDPDAVIVDRVGILLHLYPLADVAYVGGGFHDAGLHSVIEPAAAGVPVIFGPKHENAPAAAELARAGGGAEVAGAGGLAAVLGRWLGDREVRAAAAEAARGYVERHRGAAARTAELLEPLLGRS